MKVAPRLQPAPQPNRSTLAPARDWSQLRFRSTLPALPRLCHGHQRYETENWPRAGSI